MTTDDGFEALAGYDGYEFVFEQGYWAKFEFRRLDGTVPGLAHAYRYSITLHAPSGKRLMGFDNAHPIDRKSGRLRRRSASADHWHRDASDRGRPYDFVSPAQLLEDFFREASRVLADLGVPTDPIDTRRAK